MPTRTPITWRDVAAVLICAAVFLAITIQARHANTLGRVVIAQQIEIAELQALVQVRELPYEPPAEQ